MARKTRMILRRVDGIPDERDLGPTERWRRVHDLAHTAADLCAATGEKRKRAIELFEQIATRHPRAWAINLVQIAKTAHGLVDILGYDPLGSEEPRKGA
jgi:hypothetical protein